MTDDARTPVDADRLRSVLRPPWRQIEVVEETDSTSADLAGAAPGSIRVAEYQRSGRGRLDRTWSSPPRAGLLFSAVVEPGVAATTWGWLPLLTGVAVCDCLAELTGLDVSLKWPNDVLIGEQKVAGILVQATAITASPANTAVIGIGLNVSTTRAELALDSATSLALAGAPDLDRSDLLAAILTALGARLTQWTDAAGDAQASGLAAAYRARCATIGQAVTVMTTLGNRNGTATGVADDGRLRVRWNQAGPDGVANGVADGVADGVTEQALAAGDIVHLRARRP